MMSGSDRSITRRQACVMGGSALAALVLAGCGASSAAEATSGAGIDGGDVALHTLNPGTLTVATSNPAREPWVMDDEPSNGKGFEAALIYELSARLGFAADDVVWTRTSLDEAVSADEHEWDMSIQQIAISEDRRQAVDFSPAYFHPTQSIMVSAAGRYANASSVGAFADATLAVAVGTPAFDCAVELIKKGDDATVDLYSDHAAAVSAILDGRADAVVADTLRLVDMTSADAARGARIAGQIPGSEDQLGLGIALPKYSQLSRAVEDVMNALLSDGSVRRLTDEWLAAYTIEVPQLSK